MKASVSSGSGSNADSGGMSGMMGEVRCICGKQAVVKKSLTDDNPWRRFYTCGNPKWSSCNFFRWFDVDKPHGWQKNALLEARDMIREQGQELKKMRALVQPENGSEGNGSESRVQENELWSKLENENKKLKQEIVSSIEKEKLLRQFVIISWVGFVGVTAVIVNALK